MSKVFMWISLFGMVSLMLSGPVFSGSEIHPLEPVDVSSPRATLESFIQNSRKAAEAYKAGNYQEQCFDRTGSIGQNHWLWRFGHKFFSALLDSSS